MAVTSVGNESDAQVYASTGDHTLSTSGSDGSIVVLNDNSIWEVPATTDQSTVSGWTDTASITVNNNPSGSGYVLVNTDDQSDIHARYIGNE